MTVTCCGWPLLIGSAAHVAAPPLPSRLQVSIWGVVTVSGFYLPYAYLAVDLLMGKSVLPHCCGILAGHIW